MTAAPVINVLFIGHPSSIKLLFPHADLNDDLLASKGYINVTIDQTPTSNNTKPRTLTAHLLPWQHTYELYWTETLKTKYEKVILLQPAHHGTKVYVVDIKGANYEKMIHSYIKEKQSNPKSQGKLEVCFLCKDGQTPPSMVDILMDEQKSLRFIHKEGGIRLWSGDDIKMVSESLNEGMQRVAEKLIGVNNHGLIVNSVTHGKTNQKIAADIGVNLEQQSFNRSLLIFVVLLAIYLFVPDKVEKLTLVPVNRVDNPNYASLWSLKATASHSFDFLIGRLVVTKSSDDRICSADNQYQMSDLVRMDSRLVEDGTLEILATDLPTHADSSGVQVYINHVYLVAVVPDETTDRVHWVSPSHASHDVSLSSFSSNTLQEFLNSSSILTLKVPTKMLSELDKIATSATPNSLEVKFLSLSKAAGSVTLFNTKQSLKVRSHFNSTIGEIRGVIQDIVVTNSILSKEQAELSKLEEVIQEHQKDIDTLNPTVEFLAKDVMHQKEAKKLKTFRNELQSKKLELDKTSKSKARTQELIARYNEDLNNLQIQYMRLTQLVLQGICKTNQQDEQP